MIRILYMIDFLDFGGSEQHLYDLVTHINPNMFEPHILYCQGGDISSKLEIQGYKLRKMNIPKVNSLNALALAPALVRYIKENGIQIVHTLHLKADVYGTVLGKLACVPVIISSRRDTGFTRKKRHIIFQNIFLNRFVTALVVNSKAVMEAVYSREKVYKNKMKLFYNGIELDGLVRTEKLREEVRADFGIRPQDVVVGTLATFNPVKRYDLILKAVTVLRDIKQARNIRFVLVGDGITRPDLERFCRLEGLSSIVTFAGHRGDISRFLSAMDIFVNFSDSEGFSNAILQAMAMSLPIIASNVGGNPEIISDGENGYLITAGRYKDLARRIISLAEDSDLRYEMAQKNREKIESHFRIERMIKQFEELYQELLKGGLNA